jgi:hypothetical protein
MKGPDTPRFLRRSSIHDHLPALVVDDNRPVSLVSALYGFKREDWPTLLLHLEMIGLSTEVVEWIRAEGQDARWKGLSEAMIVTSFLEALMTMPLFLGQPSQSTSLMSRMISKVRKAKPNRNALHESWPDLVIHFKSQLKEVTATEWPECITQFLAMEE